MNPDLKSHKDFLSASDSLSKKEKARLLTLLEKTESELLQKENTIDSLKRELEIEAALEKVRVRSLAMQNTEELNGVLALLFKQVELLGIDAKCAHLTLMDLENNSFSFRITGRSGTSNIGEQKIDVNAMEAWKDSVETFKNSELYSHQCLVYSPEVLPDLWKLIHESLNSLPEGERIQIKDFPNGLFDCEGRHKFGYIGFNNSRPPTDEEIEIAIRFAKEFEIVYQRFLDLQKAEAQAREAHIQAALERVRARSMAMRRSSELQEVVFVVAEELKKLGVVLDVGGAVICTYFEDSKDVVHWTASDDPQHPSVPFYLPYFKDTLFDEAYASKNRGDLYFAKDFSHEVKNAWFRKAFEISDYHNLPEEYKKALLDSDTHAITFAFAENSAIMIPSLEGKLLSSEHREIIIRLVQVFEQSYTRFLDLQKAEAQAREARIESALEKVRTQSIGMQSSEDLSKVTTEMFRQLREFDANLFATGIVFCDKHEGHVEQWHSIPNAGMMSPFIVPVELDYIHQYRYDQWKQGTELFSIEIPSDFIQQHFRDIFELPSAQIVLKYFEENNTPMPGAPDWEIDYGASFKNGYLLVSSLTHFEDAEILPRFAKVFEQTYTRFLDLQKAEAQARESEIQLSLERVRARSMAMYSPDELNDVLSVFFKQFDVLGIRPVSVFLSLFDVEANTFTYRSTTRAGSRMSTQQVVDLDTLQVWKELADKWKNDKQDSIEVIYYPKEILHDLFALLDETFAAMPEAERVTADLFPEGGYAIHGYCKFGYIGYNHIRKPTAEEEHITIRFATEFGRLYQRFLDIQKAETQAREAQIEASLERVRAKTLSMHSAEELNDVLCILFEQFDVLGINPVLTHLTLFDEANDTFRLMITTSPENKVIASQVINVKAVESWENSFKTWKEGKPGTVDCIAYPVEVIPGIWEVMHEVMNALPKEYSIYPEDFPNGLYTTQGHCQYGYLGFNHHREGTEEEKKIISRFAFEFGRLYQRFLDLQKAEEQARESVVQLALERVRARTMAMHNSSELSEVAEVLFEQISSLTTAPDRFQIGIIQDDKKSIDLWLTDQNGVKVTQKFNAIAEKSSVIKGVINAWKNQDVNLVKKLTGKDLENWLRYMGGELGIPFRRNQVGSQRHINSVFFSYGFIGITTIEAPDSRTLELIGRFSKVFQQTYTRFLDLEKAEKQAREALIEAALERVRAQTMAMHNSEDVGTTVGTLFEEVMKLGLDTSIRCGIGILEGYEGMETWSATSRKDEHIELVTGMLNMTIHPMLVGLKKSWKKRGAHYSYVFVDADVRKYYEALNQEPDYPFNMDLNQLPEVEYHNSYSFAEGILFAFTLNPISEESGRVLKRFAGVFGQTYRRYLDLKKAETRAREALKQASIERVRGQISSMRSTADLERITPLIWNELTALGVPFIRCGVFIMDEPNSQIKAYLSSPDGTSLGAMTLPYDISELTHNSVLSWRNNQVYHQHWSKEDFLVWSESLIKEGHIKSLTTYQGAEAPPERLDLYFIPFAQGMFYVGNTDPLGEEALELSKSLAEAFAFAYARYEDFVRLELAKKDIEKTLSELKETQKQLIQSEKMASLGELTAGIAHEIKNPLNFVNNFSEVSRELLQELIEELKKGDLDEVTALAEDVIQNLEKIVHHGQRADGIVKGMLQHSRSSDGHKEPTDLNKLADEYVRLAYHGLRAKDKSFNATIHTEFDPSLKTVNIIPQEMGRVILNLLTNAFYAVNEKNSRSKTGEITAFEPTVSIKTEKRKDAVVLSVTDNGNGISQKVIDKIFQPFFTTKPTGQGTGLGLSMSYDIVTKGHGGELSVKSEEGEGTEFIIELPG